jgi:hypothetical protein
MVLSNLWSGADLPYGRVLRRLAVAGGMVLLTIVVVVGCSDDPVPIPNDARTVDLAAFADVPASYERAPVGPEVVAVPAAEFSAPSTQVTTTKVELADGETITRTTTAEGALNPATQRPDVQVTDRTMRGSMRVGQRWPVESLVGQINGRPIYADDFFRPIEARLIQIASDANQNQAKLAARELVADRFRALVNSELIIAEAQSRLSPEMQQGVLAWLRDMQERTIAQRGGSRSEAEKQLIEETGQDIKGWIEQRKDFELSMDLLRRKVQPRVIVSWRDVEQLYEKHKAQFEPEPMALLGRIILSKSLQAEQIELAKTMSAEGKTFAEVVQAVKARDNGEWMKVKIGPNGMELGDLAPDLAAALAPLKPGQYAGPIEQRTTQIWVAVLGEEQPERAVSIFDPTLQLALRNQLMEQRNYFERERYIAKLRSRWLSDDIQKMRDRLWIMAQDRYFIRS